jgi:hypothetical protein
MGNEELFFIKGVTWSHTTSGVFGARYLPAGHLFNVEAPTYFPSTVSINYVLAFLNSCVAQLYLSAVNSTMHYLVGNIMALPIISSDYDFGDIISTNIATSKKDWDSFETSWDFQRHPLVSGQHIVDSEQWTECSGQCVVDSEQWTGNSEKSSRQNTNHCSLLTNHHALLSDHYSAWETECNTRFTQLKTNEEELNRIFIDIYGLQEELTPEVEDKDVTVRKADLQRDIKSLLSYAVGCMFGRYSLDVDGLAYAGGDFSEQWVVISGQCYKREVVEQYVSKELSRAYGMAEVNGSCDGDLPVDQAAAERGTVCTLKSNAESCSIHSVQYRRGTTEKIYEGIQELSLDCKRFQCGITDTVYDLCSSEILDAIASGDSTQLVGRGWEDADRVDWQAIHYSLTTNHYSADADNIIPITDEEYFDDDIVGLLCAWLKKVYGADTLEENLDFIASSLGNKGNSSREIIRNYFLNDFFKDHCQTYSVTGSGKRPIYWLFDSGKQNGFKALIYLHRYTPDTIGNLRIDYLHRMQRIYESEMNRMQDMIDNSTNTREVRSATSRKEKLAKQLKECREYDEKIGHLALSRIELDLDDGVKVNYRKIQTASDGKFYEVLADSKKIMAKN